MTDLSPTVSDIHIDRLVDGQASRQEYRQLLQAAERDSAIWKRIAVAFLEAQAWQTDLEHDSSDQPAVSRKSVTTEEAGSWRQRAWAAVAAAAVFLLGWFAGDRIPWLGSQTPSTEQAAIEPGSPTNALPAVTKNDSQELPQAADFVRFRLPATDDSAQQVVEVPIYDGEPTDLGELWGAPSTEAADFLARAREQGHNTTHQVEFRPLSLRDGRKIVVPIEHVKATPVSLVTY